LVLVEKGYKFKMKIFKKREEKLENGEKVLNQKYIKT